MRFYTSLTLCALTATGFASNGQDNYRLNIRHIESGGVGYNRGYSTLEAFLSSDVGMCPFLLFCDARGHIFNDGLWAANAGIGARYLFWSRAYGINAYYDYRGAKHLKGNQLGLGLESLGTLVDLRVNGYLPFSKKVSSPYDTCFGYFEGNEMFLSQKKKMAIKGADAEMGFHFGKDSTWKFYGALGPYYYAPPLESSFWGAKASISASFKHYVTLEVSNTYDRVFRDRVQGQLSFTVPLGKNKKKTCKTCPSSALACRKIDPVRRSEIIVMKDHKTHPLAINPATNTPYNFIFVNNQSASNGTYESPYHSLADAQDASSPYDIIYVYPGDGTTRNMDQGITMQNYQKLWGTGVKQQLATTLGSISVPTMSTSAPLISNPQGSVILLSNNNEVSGVTLSEPISGVGSSGISGSNVDSIIVKNCTFLEQVYQPIEIGSAGDGVPFTAILENNSVLGSTNGFFISLNNNTPSANLIINNNLFTNTTTTIGFNTVTAYVEQCSIPFCIVRAYNNNFYNAEGGGIQIATSSDGGITSSFGTLIAEINNNTVVNSSDRGAFIFNLDAEYCNIKTTNNYASNNIGGFLLNPSNHIINTSIRSADVLVKNNQFINSKNFQDGINIYTLGSILNLTVVDNNLSNNAGSGLITYNTPNIDQLNINISRNIIENNQNMNANASGGISIDGFNNLTGCITANTISGNSNNTCGSSICGNGASTPNPNGNMTLSLNNNTFDDGLWINWDGANTACVTMQKNSSTQDPAYTLINQNVGTFNIAPINYQDVNKGAFTLGNVIPVPSCGGGSQ